MMQKAFLHAPSNHWLVARSFAGPDDQTACPHPMPSPTNEGAEGWRRDVEEGKAERERSRPTPSVGTRPCPWPRSPSFHMASRAWRFLADLTHYTSMLFLNPLSKQKQALLEMCISPSKSPDTHIIHFLTLLSDPSLGGPPLPASSYLSLIYRFPQREN